MNKYRVKYMDGSETIELADYYETQRSFTVFKYRERKLESNPYYRPGKKGEEEFYTRVYDHVNCEINNRIIARIEQIREQDDVEKAE